VDGRDLATVLHEDGPFQPAAACRLAAVIAEALDAAHSQGVVHGRLHPGNVLLLPDGRSRSQTGDVRRAPGPRRAGAADR
jgi:serine/threonine-protein kinase